jgi:DNA-binding MarR family transcriptional regulator
MGGIHKVDSSIDRMDINILYSLYMKNKTSPLYSAQIKNIIEYCEISSSYNTVVRRAHKLVNEGYLDMGYNDGRAKTFYLNDKGKELIRVVTDKEKNIYEEISIDNERND